MRVPSIRFAHVRRGKAEEPPGIVGVARVDLKTKVLVRRLEPGDIAVIDHPDLDRVSADELIACRVAAVVNASKSVTGRYPNLGPGLLLTAGIPVIDDVGREVLPRVADGTTVRLDKDTLYNASDQVIAKGVLLTEAALATAMDDANAGVPTQIDSFAANTLEFLQRERDLLTNGIDLPEARHDHEGQARPGGRPRLPLPRGPARPAALHPRVPPGAARRGRRRGRPP